MRRLTTSLTLFLLVFFLPAIAKHSFAIGLDVKPIDDSNNPVAVLDENTARAKITFSGLPDNTYTVCLGWGALSGSDCADSGVNHFRHVFNNVTGETLSIIVCGGNVHGIAGSTTINDLPGLKLDTASDHCSGNDFFHAHNYAFELQPSGGTKTKWNDGVKVDRFIPTTTFSTTTPKPTDDLSFTISGSRRPASFAERNNYEFDFKRDDGLFTAPHLNNVTVPSSGSVPVHIGTLQTGDYTLRILRPNGDLNGEFDNKWYDVLRVAATFHIKVDATSGSITGGATTSAGSPGACESNPAACNPCTTGPTGTCETGIGPIPTNLKGFAEKFLAIGTGIAGGIALILMVIGSIRVLASSGDQQKLNGGREMIIAALAGLLFLIFSVLILRFIGLNLLGGITTGGGAGGGSGGFSFILGNPTISGTTATFSIAGTSGGGAGVGSVLFIKDLATSIPIPTGATSIPWTGAAGTHSAVISGFGVDISNTVTFTLGGGAVTCRQVDFDGDGSVSILDLTLLTSHFGSKTGDANYDVKFDLNRDGFINSADSTIFNTFFGQRC